VVIWRRWRPQPVLSTFVAEFRNLREARMVAVSRRIVDDLIGAMEDWLSRTEEDIARMGEADTPGVDSSIDVEAAKLADFRSPPPAASINDARPEIPHRAHDSPERVVPTGYGGRAGKIRGGSEVRRRS